MDRREFLKALGAFGAVVAARPFSSLASITPSSGASRTSRLPASAGLSLAYTDLHNHSLISGDAFGDPYTALRDIHKGGIDVACMTEHAISGKDHGRVTCPGWEQGGCQTVEGINSHDWQAMARFADAAYRQGSFVSFRGFEYSTPTVGHLNVWFSSMFTDPLHELALVTPKAISEADRLFPPSQPVVDLFEDAPDIATIRPFYRWLASSPDRPVLGGGSDGIACFNHPNDFGDFQSWTYHPGAARRITMFEAFNTNNYQQADFFWSRADEGMPNPFNACLSAGWRVGFTGVSDEHSPVYGRPNMARGGLWVTGLSRRAVRDALVARRSFATLEPGLRVDATANGAPMGSAFAHSTGPVTIVVDIDAGPAWTGKPLWIQVIRPGESGPTLAQAVPVTVPAPTDPLISFTVPVNRGDGDWLFLRVIDPDLLGHPHGLAPFEDHGGAVAYASPWFLDPA